MSTGAADFVSCRFSTRQLPERMRIPLWRENFGRSFVHVDANLDFSRAVLLGATGFGITVTQPMRVPRNPQDALIEHQQSAVFPSHGANCHDLIVQRRYRVTATFVCTSPVL